MTSRLKSGRPPKRSAGIKRSRIKKKARSKSDFARIYGSKQRVEFVKSLPCAACGVVGYSENAHVAPASEKGTGYKAGFEWIVPLCGYREVAVLPRSFEVRFGCHGTYDKMRWAFDKAYPDFNATEAAAQTERAWRASQGETE